MKEVKYTIEISTDGRVVRLATEGQQILIPLDVFEELYDGLQNKFAERKGLLN